MNAINTITAGSHTNGGNITHVFSRSGPNIATIGVETTAMTTMFSRSSDPARSRRGPGGGRPVPRWMAHATGSAVRPVTMSKFQPE